MSGDEDLTIPGWIAQGSPSLEGVEYLGSIYHQGRGAGGAADPALRLDRGHRLQPRGRAHRLGRAPDRTDERGGGIVPPGASCTPAGDNLDGNGGVHFYRPSALSTTPPATPEEAFAALREHARRRARRSTGPRSAPSRERRSARRTSSSRSRARTGSSWAGTRRARR